MLQSVSLRRFLIGGPRKTLRLVCRALSVSSLELTAEKRELRKRHINKLFDDERKRQANLIPRIEKIEVIVKDARRPDSDVTLVMNKFKSTPQHCAQHVHELYSSTSACVELDNGQLWDMHRPLESDTTLRFRNFTDDNANEVNKIFWRSCSFILGMVIETAFKDSVPVVRHSWPKPNLKAGSFVYDVALPTLPEWTPAFDEMRTLTSVMWKIKDKKSRFERLEVDSKLAKDIFAGNEFKIGQIDSITATNDKVSLYRLDDHIDISIGPMIADTSLIGRANVAAVHKIDSADGPLYRFQGIAIPRHLTVSHYAYKVLCSRAREPYST